MKLLAATLFSMTLFAAVATDANAARVNSISELDKNGNGIFEPGEVDECTEVQCGPCTVYCPVTRFKREDYCETKCVDEPYTVSKKCCRYVDQPYTVKKCRMVPEYYTKTFEKKCCRQVPEYYTVRKCRMVPQYYEVTKCRMVPEEYCKYYTKKYCRKVPQYYDVQCCRKVPEYYNVCEQKCRKKYIKENRCRYVPYTCMVQKCMDLDVCGCDANGNQSSNWDRQNNNYADDHGNGNDDQNDNGEENGDLAQQPRLNRNLNR